MIRRLVVSREAETDLTLIWVYHAEKSEWAARRIRADIVSKYDLLLDFPHLGRERNELRLGLGSFPFGNYVIFYQEIEDGIEIVRVLHGAQDALGVFPPEGESDNSEM
jgi:toxin ParE1/3/4